ncbi:polysaccharide deacetylase family protein [Heyndrickxia camelliae]|uniref:Polysaccharide deacetylase n=1 Tax=Heyndrickxia camelliae TaxID=1707093 RepID=A0A2N3LMD7_9BACI|nr:polysaccharide deacetylase family protein [Heyndrickxia camelliae]PKR85766.1 polysaccharide deacetylase [Heyndrickxia camelliae]
MNRASKNHNKKLLAKYIIGFLLISVVLLLFYNSKIAEGDLALAKNTSTMKATPNQIYPTRQNILQDSFIHNLVFNEEVKEENMLQNELWKEIEETPMKIAISPLTKTEPKKFLNKQKTKSASNDKNLVRLKSPSTKAQKVVYLTFDDGPSISSAKTLELLKKYHAKATFFMLEPNIKKYPKIVKQMVRDGNSIGSHGVTHDIHKIYRSPNAFVKEMSQTSKTLKKITGVNSQLIRVPYGSVPYMKPAFRKASDLEGFIMWDWDIDSDDWQTTKGEYVWKIKNQVENCSGTRPLVILMHEKTTTFKYLEKVLQYFQQKGYKMEAISPNLQPVQFKYR